MIETYAFNERFEDARTMLDQAMQEYAAKEPRFSALSPDLVRSGMAAFSHAYPNRTYNMGIAETSCIDFAAGMAVEGRLPVIYGMSAFLSMRSCEAIRTNLCYQNLHVVILGNNTGLAQGPAGSTHYALEDMAIMRLFPGMTLIAPADPAQTVKAFYAAIDTDGPVYIRMSNGRHEPSVYKQPYNYKIGKGIQVRAGSDVCIFACGIMVAHALEAARQLETDGVHASVVDMHTIKPIDRELVIRMAQQTNCIVTVEDAFICGGLGTAVSEIVAQEGLNCRVKPLGIPDVFPGFGSFGEQMDHYGYDVAGIQSAALSLIRSK